MGSIIPPGADGCEYKAGKVVFNTGVNKETLLHNFKLLKTDPSEVDCIVINHGNG